MSVMEIPDGLYRVIRDMEIARQVAKGLDIIAAKSMADDIMSHCFVARSAQIQCESQKDYYEAEHEGDWTR